MTTPLGDAASDDGTGDITDDIDSGAHAGWFPSPQCDDSSLTARQVRDLILRALI